MKHFPAVLRDRLWDALGEESPIARHEQLLRLGIDSLRYFASLAFADYRNQRAGEPDEGVEELLHRFDQPFLGHYRDLLEGCLAATAVPGAFGERAFETRRFVAVRAFLASIHAIRIAVNEQGATRLDRILRRADEEHDRSEAAGAEWRHFWTGFVTYRNAMAHGEEYGWADLAGYHELMTPRLEAALVEALTLPEIAVIVTGHPIARLEAVEDTAHGYIHVFRGEGLREEVVLEAPAAERWPHPLWRGIVGGLFLLSHVDDSWGVVGPYHDFLGSADAPAPIPVADERISTLLGRLRDQRVSPTLRRRAARELGRFGKPRVFNALKKAIDDRDERVREAAADAMGRLLDSRAREPLVQHLEDVSERVRVAAAVALARFGDFRAIDPLAHLLDSDNSGIREDVAMALRDIGLPQAIPPLLRALRDPFGPVRHRAAEGLALLQHDQTIQPLRAALEGEQDPHVWGGIAWALAQIPDRDTMALFGALLRDEHQPADRRRTAAYALGVLSYNEARTPLVAALEDADEGVQIEAVWALREVGGDEARLALERKLRSSMTRRVAEAVSWALDTLRADAPSPPARKDVVPPSPVPRRVRGMQPPPPST